MADPNGGTSCAAKKHDVFLSFRGEDTRVGFTSHLYDALRQKSIGTYIDSQLNRGDDVWPALEKAIEDSQVSIVVFSENYATSKWCLEELVKILECRRDQGQVVIPVFHETDPSHIRKQTGSYEKAFAKHERDLGDKDNESKKQKVARWKAALTEAANISGWDSRSRTHKDESKLIENVVNDVIQKLQLRYPNELEGIVGTEKNCQYVETLMKSVRVLGIWGMGGMGKTTIAKVLFAKLFAQYDHVCLANAKEYSLSKLLSELLKEDISPSNVVGSTFHMRRLRSKKVFIVLDNVDSLDQFEFLCRGYGDVSHDSRLVITTRDRQLLSERVDLVYEVKQWEDPESLKLFCLEAFKQSRPKKGYEDLSQRAVAYAGGVPLALKVLGSYLRSKGTRFWKSTFRKLDKYPKEEIQKVLKVSYDGLDPLEKKIFLDIAFFFKGEEKDRVIRILDACGFEASSGIEVLEDKALITISSDNRIQMHDLLQKMGTDIICNDCGINPATHTRLSESEAHEVIKENKGTNYIEGITLDLTQYNDLPLCADTFSKMKALRILKFYIPLGESCSNNTYNNLPPVLEPFSNELRYFKWIGYPFKSLREPFCAKFLVEIHIPHSNVERLWQGMQELDKLEGIDLTECRHFVELPDLSKASRLKWVILSGCESLRDLHPSVLCADTLVTLILDRCTKLTRVKGEKHLKYLEKISVNGCTGVKEFAVSSDKIENLDLSSTGIQTLDLSIGRLRKLKRLNLESLKLQHLPKELSSLTSIKELKISGSGLIVEKQQLQVLFDGLRCLKILHLKDCSNLVELPDNMSVLSDLQELRLDRSNVKRLPESIKQLQKLEIVSLEDCRELEHIPELPPLIKWLFAVNCKSLVSVANLKTLATKMMGNAKNISFRNSLSLDANSLKCIMESLHLTMMSAAFQNVIVRSFGLLDHSYNYTCVEACVPGRWVPRKFSYRTTESTSIAIDLPNRSNSLGFIYSVVLSPATGGNNGTKKDGSRIICHCRVGESVAGTSSHADVTELNSDHVYVWYDPFHYDSIIEFYEPKVCFEFSVANDAGEVDGSICIKECGVRLIRVEELQSVLPELDLDWDKKMDLKREVERESGCSITLTPIIETSESDRKENGGMKNQIIQNQQQDSCEETYNNSIDVTEPKSAKVEPESAEEDNRSEDHFPNAARGIGSTNKEIKTNTELGRVIVDNITNFTETVKRKRNMGITPNESDAGLKEYVESQPDRENASKHKSITKSRSVTVKLESAEEDNKMKDYFSDVEVDVSKRIKNSTGMGRKENTTESTKSAKSKGTEGTPTESDAGGLHLPVMPVVEESASEDKSSENNYDDWLDNIEETEHSEENPNLQERQIIVPDSDTSDLNTIAEPEHEKEINEPMEMDLAGEPEIGEELDGSSDIEDPFAELESIMLGTPKSWSAKAATCSTSDVVTIRDALDNLEYLLENSLESILGDIELQQQLHVSLECIKQAADSSHKTVSPNVAKLVESMASSVEHLFEEFALTQKVVEDHIGCLQQREKLEQRVRDAQKRNESAEKEKSRCKDGTERLEKEGNKLDEKIRTLVEQKTRVELGKTKLKETMERCDAEKKKVKEEARKMIREGKELMSAIEDSKTSCDAALSKQQKLNDKWEGFRTTLADNWESRRSVIGGNMLKAELLILFIFVFVCFLTFEGPEVNLH